ncbi:YbhB/YbcL family Raf kinase inhibitor-like protein [Sphaerisporangium sp. NPDC051011]|uniref:YbhB/YbcL family Raf kinase inhibitor-like protein n=1 Tax=Sphaerisporangium sp. NPDC051011 TaxID=3155792 RepID=UPI0033E338A4
MGQPRNSVRVGRRGRDRRVLVIAAIVAAASGCGIVGGGSPTDGSLDGLSVSSPRIRDGAPLPADYSCAGKVGNPPLRWSGVIQKQTKSIALVVDANNAQGTAEVHWVVYNIDPLTPELAPNSVPRGAVEGMTSSGKPGYSPPCRRDDIYRFSVYALDAKLDPKKATGLRETLELIAQHTISRGRLTASHIE